MSGAGSAGPSRVEVGGGRLDSVRGPALVMVDCQRLFTLDATAGSEGEAAVLAAGRAAEAAREREVPVVWLRTLFAEESELGPVWSVKAPALRQLLPSAEVAALDERVGYREGEPILTKKRASGFVGTELDALLRRLAVTSCAIAGFTTGGCVRATAVDAASLDYLPTVFRDAVSDRTRETHQSALADLGARYADVTESSIWLSWIPRHAR